MCLRSRGPSEFATEMPWPEIAWEDAVQGLGIMSIFVVLICLLEDRSVREKQENVVCRQRVLQTVTSRRIVSLMFRGHDLLKITKINTNPQQEATLLVWKKLVPRESAGNGA